MDKGRVISKSALQALIVLAIAIVTNQSLFSIFGLYIWAFTFFLYINQLGKTVPVLELMMLVATSQWILGPVIDYNTEADHFKYYMYVEEDTYMSFVVPGTLVFILAILIKYPTQDLNRINNYLKNLADTLPRLAYYLMIIGFVSDFVRPILPNNVAFIFYLFSNLKFLGAALLLFKPKSVQKWWVLTLVMLLTLMSSLAFGMFHDLILWSSLLLSFVVLNLKIGFFKKVSVILAGFFALFILQSIKGEYRNQIWEQGYQEFREEVSFFDLAFNRVQNIGFYMNESYINEINVRLNQGWIISALLSNVPENVPYAEGETITTAVSSSLIPRFLVKNKAKAGGQENFERFTGLRLHAFTSMGISILGEAYVNYGVLGGWLFMLIWGFVLAFVYRFLVRRSFKEPLLYIFFPLIFLQVVKAETELLVVLNHLVKSLILSFAVIWLLNKIFGQKLKSLRIKSSGE